MDVDTTITCNAIIPERLDTTLLDNCGLIVSFNEQITDGCEGMIRRVWIAEDMCGEKDSLVQVITIIDDEAPTFNGTASNITVDCENIPPATSFEVMDNCDENPVVVFSEISNLYEKSCEGFRPLDLSTIQELNNTTIANQPILATVANSMTFNSDITANHTSSRTTKPQGLANGDLRFGNNNNTEVSEYRFVFEKPLDLRLSQAELSGAFELLETWTITSVGGGVLSVHKPIVNVTTNNNTNWNDTELNNVTGNGTNQVTFSPKLHHSDGNIAVSDSEWNITGYGITELTLRVGMANTSANVTRIKVSVDCVPYNKNEEGCLETITRKWLAIDNCGNQDSLVQVITVEDTEAPTFVGVPNDTTVDCNNIPVAATVTATDNCDTSVEVDYEEIIGDGCPYTITRTWTSEDACGNIDSVVQVITVEDTEAPTFVGVPNDTTVDCNNIPVAATVTATDNCDTDIEVIFKEIIGDGCPYTITRTWTSEDACGNIDSVVQVITVEDTEAPVFSNIPLDIILPCDSIPENNSPVVSDNCANVDFVFSENETQGDCIDQRILTRTWTATDSCGNTSSVSQNITFTNCSPDATITIAPSNIVCEGTEISFEVTLTDGYDTPNYQWQYSQDGIIWTDIIGANNSIYTNTVLPSDAGIYRVIVANDPNDIGNEHCNIISNSQTLLIIAQQVSIDDLDVEICFGDSIAVGNSIYFETGSFIDTLQAISGCDLSLIHI